MRWRARNVGLTARRCFRAVSFSAYAGDSSRRGTLTLCKRSGILTQSILILAMLLGHAGQSEARVEGLRVTVLQDGRVELAWNRDPTTGSPDTEAVKYLVGYRTDVVPEQIVDAGDNITYTFTTLTRGQRFYFRVYAANVFSLRSAPSNEVDATIPPTAPDTTPPTMPTGLVGSAASMFQINLAWAASTDNNAVTGYDILRNSVVIASVTSTTYSDNGLTPASTYAYTVRAKDAAGNLSAESTLVMVSTLGDTAAPTTPGTLVASLTTTNSVSLTWGASMDNIGVTAYRLTRNGTQIVQTGGVTFADSGLTPATTYVYTVVALDAAGNVSSPSSVSVTTQSLPALNCVTNGKPYSITIGNLTLLRPQVGPGLRGTVLFTLINLFPVSKVQVLIGTSVVGEAPLNAQAGAVLDMRDIAGLNFTVPRTPGIYQVSVLARDVFGCSSKSPSLPLVVK